MRQDWDRIVGFLTENGIRTAIITNGWLFTDRILARLKELDVESVAVSIDGPEDVHDKYRQPGSRKRAEEALGKLIAHGIVTTVISTLNGENALRLEEMYDWLRTKRIAAWQLQACSPMGNAALSGVPFRFDAGRVIRFVEEHRESAPFPMGIADNIGYFTETEGFLRGDPSGEGVFPGCSAGLTTIGIDSEGNVRGCESMYDDRFIEGNLRKQSLREIWESPDAFAYNRKFTPEMLTGACASCEKGPWCAGGCRSYNYFVHGKLYESPLCARRADMSAQ